MTDTKHELQVGDPVWVFLVDEPSLETAVAGEVYRISKHHVWVMFHTFRSYGFKPDKVFPRDRSKNGADKPEPRKDPTPCS